MKEYTKQHAIAGIKAKLPRLECWQNQFKGYEIIIEALEFTSVCPKTGMPDFGTITIHYMPDKLCLELKSLKLYINSYRNLGIFQENSVNKILADIVSACKPKWALVRGEFNARGGIKTVVEAKYRNPHKRY